MNTQKFFVGRTIGAILFLVIVAVIGFSVLNNHIYEEKQTDGVITEPYRATLTGIQTCLPHRDTTGPQTLECAIGMLTDAGEYYVLDFTLMSQIPPNISDGKKFTASGLVTPIERLSTDQWQKYAVEGIFSVTDSVAMDTPKGEPLFSWRHEEADTLNLDGNPNYDVFLDLKYPGGETENILVDTTPGGCGELPDTDPQSVTGTKVLQCYYAGFGHQYRIVKGEQTYRIERKEVEEGTAEFTPPEQQYETFKDI